MSTKAEIHAQVGKKEPTEKITQEKKKKKQILVQTMWPAFRTVENVNPS